MGFAELFLIAVGLSMDAFAVSLCKGLCMSRINYRHAVIIAAFFGGFQMANPLLGWLLGWQFEQYIAHVDHWIAFGLLAVIGSKMLFEALKKGTETPPCTTRLDLKELIFLSLATSIDALAVGITFALLKVSILPSVGLIGLVTFVICLTGVIVGHKFGARFRTKAEIAGGVILILIGLRILFGHLNII
jgi:putative Mn2+ efflux pump MntP